MSRRPILNGTEPIQSPSAEASNGAPRVFKNEFEVAAVLETIAELAAQICSGEEGSDGARAYAIQKLAEAAALDVQRMDGPLSRLERAVTV